MTEQWMSIVEYARACNISDMTVRRRIKTGKLHAKLIDNKYYIPIHAAGLATPDVEASPSATASSPTGSHHASSGSGMVVIKGHPAAHKTLQAGSVGAAPRPAAPAPAPASARSAPAPARSAPAPARSAPTTYAAGFGHDMDGSDDRDNGLIPSSLTRPLLSQDVSIVDTKALLAFCEASMRKAAEAERRTVERFKSKLEALEATLQSRDLELASLRQQLEDLQMLVKYLDPKKRPG